MTIRNRDQVTDPCDVTIEFEAKSSGEIPSTASTTVDQDVIDWDGPDDAR